MVFFFSLAGMADKVFLVFCSVFWHELSHVVTASFLGCKTREIEFLPFGGVARIEGLLEAGTKKEAVIATAGPLSSLLLAALAMPAAASPVWEDAGKFLVEVNVALAAFNMLPALPLDGGRITRAWLHLFLDYGQASRLTVLLTKMTTFGLLLFVLGVFMLDGTLHLSLILASILLYVSARSEIQLIALRTMKLLARKKALLAENGVMPSAHVTALGHTLARNVVELFGPNQYGVILVVDEGCRPRGSLTETEIWEGLPQRGANARIEEFLTDRAGF